MQPDVSRAAVAHAHACAMPAVVLAVVRDQNLVPAPFRTVVGSSIVFREAAHRNDLRQDGAAWSEPFSALRADSPQEPAHRMRSRTLSPLPKRVHQWHD